jgi:hypothetical protein
MTNKEIRAKALRILSKDKPTKGELAWWLDVLAELELSNLTWEHNLAVDVPIKNRNVGGSFKLSKTDMFHVRAAYSKGDVSQVYLAKEYGVSVSTIQLTLYPEKRNMKKDLVVTN